MREKKKHYDAEVTRLENEMARLKALIVADMGTSCKAVYEDGADSYTITFNPTRKVTIPKEMLERLREVHPDIYKEYAIVSISRRFDVKKAKPEAA